MELVFATEEFLKYHGYNPIENKLETKAKDFYGKISVRKPDYILRQGYFVEFQTTYTFHTIEEDGKKVYRLYSVLKNYVPLKYLNKLKLND